jgi:hypothetical protein
LYSPLSFSLNLRRIGNLTPRLKLRPNRAGVRRSSVPLDQGFLSFVQRFLAGVQRHLPFSQPLLSRRVLLLA